MKGASDLAKWVRILRSRVAPRLSEFETNMYLNPPSKSASRRPEPTRAAYKSPCPGGHHSFDGLLSQVAGWKVVASILGTLFCNISSPSSEANSGYFPDRYSSVSALVEKLFISMNLTFVPNSSLIFIICFAVRSRNVSSPFTLRRDLALSRPIPVPRPPLSLSTTVSERRVVSGSREMESAETRSGEGVIVDSGIIPVLPDTRELKVDSKALIADWEISSFSILALHASKEAMIA
mmetsp:Transcript_4943/g.6811  ORF Transcript_4943/g.6811 Transcript_4943/m.6811 type:complete len:236 (-) Transcript_4943:100-807(-)